MFPAWGPKAAHTHEQDPFHSGLQLGLNKEQERLKRFAERTLSGDVPR